MGHCERDIVGATKMVCYHPKIQALKMQTFVEVCGENENFWGKWNFLGINEIFSGKLK